jgi:hypothetical protein
MIDTTIQPKDAKDADKIYNECNKELFRQYARYWMDFFEKHGFVADSGASLYAGDFDIQFSNRSFRCICCPSRYSGVKIYEIRPNTWGGNETKFRSESGAIKWMKREQVGCPA